ncbi:hypothetical protein ACQPYK_08620 [Streptosporangium sp. CA-135522]|uniref:hypothetical protein n=1 Tax=Streptosporangium sp. CA-135522 TaxID=3240072 RepID=UPI003D90262C
MNPRLRSRLAALGVRLASPAGTLVRIVSAAGPGLLGLGLVAYGAWLAWPPAGPMSAGALLLADQAYARVRGDRS